MATLDGLNGALYIDNVQYTRSTTLGISLERSVAEALIQQQTFSEKAVGPVSGDFTGSGVLDDASTPILDEVTAGTSSTVTIYPTNDTSNYWTFTGFFTTWAVTGPSDGFWTVDFGGIVDGTVTSVF